MPNTVPAAAEGWPADSHSDAALFAAIEKFKAAEAAFEDAIKDKDYDQPTCDESHRCAHAMLAIPAVTVQGLLAKAKAIDGFHADEAQFQWPYILADLQRLGGES